MKISVAMGDGIGPEIMKSVLAIFNAASVPLQYEFVAMGKSVAVAGEKSGISPEAKASVESSGILFKGPMETPSGGGYKSVNVTARKMWGAFANKRVYRILPGVKTPMNLKHLDLTMVRENIEDTYGAVEHMQTHDVAQCRRFITRPGCEQVHRYTFEMAVKKGAKRVTCVHKANIMKMTDGLFLKTFYEVAKNYPQFQVDDIIVDALAMKLVLDPTEFDVLVLTNLQGDILTDLAAGIVGGLAYAPSANIGESICIFEAVHGTAPDIIGQNKANPTALLLSGTMMLRHLGLNEHAKVIETALDATLRAMNGTLDSVDLVNPFTTTDFTARMTARLKDVQCGPATAHAPAPDRSEPRMRVTKTPETTAIKGVDVFLESALSPRAVADQLLALQLPLKMTMMSNRGTQVWPTGSVFTDCVNHYRVRFEGGVVSQHDVINTLNTVSNSFMLCGAEWLREIDGELGFSLAQGQG